MENKIVLELNAEEVQALGALLDAAVKATGMQGAKAGVHLFSKLERAVEEFNKSASEKVDIQRKPEED